MARGSDNKSLPDTCTTGGGEIRYGLRGDLPLYWIINCHIM